ncbi:VOC family protein [Pontiellaceae bacterium B1224]|nr:VOC family protein [Pontiellaceae bacterium B1224]
MAITSGVDHVGLAVRDLPETRKFFTDILGFEEVGGVPDYPASFVSDGTIMITLWQTEDDPFAFDRMAQIGLHHLALRVESLDKLQQLFQTLENTPDVLIECPPVALESGNGTHFMSLEPGGIRIEFITRETKIIPLEMPGKKP